jgi:YHS domain-containing protein
MALTRPRLFARLLPPLAAIAALLVTLPSLAGPASIADGTGIATTNAGGKARLAQLPPLVGIEQRSGRHVVSGLALEGFDPVSYFLGNAPEPGRPSLEVVWGGAAWRFTSEANRAAFLSRPQVYSPRLGGFDALAMSEGRLVEAGARVAAVAGGKLYLFHSRASRDAFLDDPKALERAERVWREQRARLARL